MTQSLWQFLRRNRTVYTCGNCRETFATEEKLRDHRKPTCPIVAVERQIRAWNERAVRKIAYRKAAFDA